MADLGQSVDRRGTAIVFGEASSTTVCGGYTTTLTLSVDALADAAARMSAECDLGSGDLPRWLLIQAGFESGTAPTAGNRVDFYISWSVDGTNYGGGVSGADAAWPPIGSNEDEWAVQLGSPAISVIATNNGNTVQIQNAVRVPVKGRYFAVVCDNNLGQAIRNETTNSDNATGLVAWPLAEWVTS